MRVLFAGVSAIVAVVLATGNASAHCDTLDGPVVQDARKAIKAKDVTPVLKWVTPDNEEAVRHAFKKIIVGKEKPRPAAELEFFETVVRIHRAGEGATFSGLKPAGAVEPIIAEADRALSSGSADALVKLVTEEVAAGIRKRHGETAVTSRHKDESVAQGREFVKAYVEYTHYLERLHHDATGKGGHGGTERDHDDKEPHRH